MYRLILLTIWLILLLRNSAFINMFIKTIRNYRYFIWLNKINTSKFYLLKFIFGLITLILMFPIISFYPYWEYITLGCIGNSYVPLAADKDTKKYDLCKKMNNKYEWYKIFTTNNINTPEIYYLNKHKLLYTDPNKFYIMKPIYGSQGTNIKKVKLKNYLKIISNTSDEYLLQEYIKDCFTSKARHFRITTLFIENNAYIFSISEYKQSSNLEVSNKTLGGIRTDCKNLICDFLNNNEIKYLENISKKLLKLHKNTFSICPFIGFDLTLSCEGPVVFEGNLGGCIPKNLYKEYYTILWHLYSV